MKTTADTEWVLCEIEGCPNRIKNHRWGLTKADDWFFSWIKDEAYCPDHIPDWVHDWRERRRKSG